MNFGSVLQAYALKTKLQCCVGSGEVEIIDYVNKLINRNDYNLISFCNMKRLLNAFLLLPFKIVKRLKFSRFMSKYLFVPRSIKYYRKTIKYIDGKYDLYIVGSDQVWNFTITGGDTTYLLDFVSDECKKISYASSFGFEDVFASNRQVYLQYLRSFREISLREEIGYGVLVDEAMKPHIHIDPTFLLDRTEWLKFVKKSNEEYILFYNILRPNKLYNYAKKLSEQENTRILEIDAGITSFVRFPGSKKVFAASVEDILSSIANAKYIFTTSFHGAAFSVIFNKKFFTELNCIGHYNYRVDNLLKTLGLEDRTIENFNGDFDREVNWVSIEKRIKAEQVKSLEYLRGVTDT